MKMTKRIFIAFLIVAVTLSACAFSVFADEKEASGYGYVLEYYEEPIVFDYDFTNAGVNYSSSLLASKPEMVTSAFVDDENVPGGKYLSVKIASSDNFWDDIDAVNNVYFNWNSDDSLDDFVINFTASGAKGDGDESKLPKIILSVADATCTDAFAGSSVGVTVAALDYRAGCFSYLKKVVNADDSVEGIMTNTSYAVEAGKWYDVSVAYDGENVTVTVTDLSDSQNVLAVTDAYVPYEEVRNVRIGAHSIDGASARGSEMRFSRICAVGGNYNRVPSNRQTDIENIVLAMYADFSSEETGVEDKGDIAAIAKKLVGYGFTSENEDVAAAIDVLLGGVAPYCNEKLAYCIDTFNSLSTYYDKRDLVDETLLYVDYVEGMDLSDLGEEMLAELLGNVDEVKALDVFLDLVEESTLNLIGQVGSNTTIDYDDYVAVKLRYDELYENGRYADPTYEGATDAYLFYAKVSEAESDIRTKAELFIENVAVANDGSLGFDVRAKAFLVCKNSFYSNDTYPGLSSAVSVYNSIYHYINTQIEEAENFIKYVNKADYADYLSAKQENLDEAQKYISCNPDYEGVAEAKLLYAEVDEYIKTQKQNAKLYVDAVNALSSLSGDALTQAINTALALQEAGNVLGAEGVTEANIKLNQLVSSIELAAKYNAHFIGLVDSISTTTSSAELYKLFAEAKVAELDADKSYEDVAAASQKLTDAIADYNAKVAAANADFAKANETAANTCGMGKNFISVADRVIALIKKFFDEE